MIINLFLEGKLQGEITGVITVACSVLTVLFMTDGMNFEKRKGKC